MVLELYWKALLKSQMGSYLSWTQPKSRREKTVVDEAPEDRGQSDPPIPVQLAGEEDRPSSTQVPPTWRCRLPPRKTAELEEMATPLLPLPAPFGRALHGIGTGSSRTRRAASLDSMSGSSPRRVRPAEAASLPQRQSPSPRTRLRVRGSSVEFSSSPRAGWEERPFLPTVLGYEVMEERSKFTVYKILVQKSQQESWVVFRRYTDFARLNDKLKEMFPGFRLSLPPKRWFKDNYNSSFLEERQHGLQTFLQNLVAHKDVAGCLPVRDFLCLDDPPGPFDSLEESRAFCETLEDCNHRLQKELQEKQREINTLRKMLNEQQLHINTLERALRESLTPGSSCQFSIQGSESSVDENADGDVECSATEADQEMDENAAVFRPPGVHPAGVGQPSVAPRPPCSCLPASLSTDPLPPDLTAFQSPPSRPWVSSILRAAMDKGPSLPVH
ncbi:sorting nexin-16-like isoform X2 [Paramormyrops kingsleyae]|uniref:sorting nexin-16-like isoform X2 n=1 Tax=Paramormyrops kingsleyae TaxID=1676925 RepID=UPI003B97B5C8